MKSLSVTIQMKATEQHFSVVLFVMLYKVVLTFDSGDEILNKMYDHSNQVKAIEQYFPLVLYKAILTFDSVDEILKCDHSNKSY